MTTITEADVKEAALAWLTDLGWSVAHGPDIAADAVVAPGRPPHGAGRLRAGGSGAAAARRPRTAEPSQVEARYKGS